MTEDLPVILKTEEDTTERYCLSERYIIGELGHEGLCRFSFLEMAPDVAVQQFTIWREMPENAGGDLKTFLIFCERQALLVELPRTSRPH